MPHGAAQSPDSLIVRRLLLPSVSCLFHGLFSLYTVLKCVWFLEFHLCPKLLPTLQVFFPSHCFRSYLFANTSQICGSTQDLSPELQYLHLQLLYLQCLPQFIHWLVRSSKMSSMPSLPTCTPQGLHCRKHCMYFLICMNK